MASASDMASTGTKDEFKTTNDSSVRTLDNEETSLLNEVNDKNTLVTKADEDVSSKTDKLENGQRIEQLNGEKQKKEDEEGLSLHEKLNGGTANDNQMHENSEQDAKLLNNVVFSSSTIKSEDDKIHVAKTTQGDMEHESHDKLDKTESLTPSQNTIEKTTENIDLTKNSAPSSFQLPHRQSPNGGTHHTGGCHKFSDEESRAEYMKIKSEVTGEAQTSESEEEEETVTPEHSHPGSHSSPDAKTKAEYRKIKYEVTGEALTSESEDENAEEGEKLPEDADEAEEWMDIFGNGLLKRRVGY